MSDAAAGVIGSLEAVLRYPVKSMIGEARLAQARVSRRGLIGDRAYALLDPADESVASAKHPRKWGRLLALRAAFVDEPADDADASVPPVRITLPDGRTVRSDDVTIDALLSQELGRPVRLATRPPPHAGYEDVWPDIEGLAPPGVIAKTRVASDDASETVSRFRLGLAAPGTFFDIAPVHLLTTASLERARQLYPPGQFAVARFRPNLVIRTAPGAADFVENDWVGHRVRIGGEVVLQVTLRVPRCVMTTLPQGDLPPDLGILRTLAAYNRVEYARLGQWACFGVYASVIQSGIVRPGDAVVLEQTT